MPISSHSRFAFRTLLLATGTVVLTVSSVAQTEPQPPKQTDQSAQIETGQAQFGQRCAFCHGRDAAGGETGADLTSSKLVGEDIGGDKIGPVVRNGRPDKGMPAFNLSDQELAAVVAFIHDQKKKAESQVGGRRGVDASDLQTGNVEAGKRYFNGSGECSSCHSPEKDFAGLATRYQGLKLEERMLYPAGVKATATVTLPSGKTLHGKVDYRDEFTLGISDDAGWYHSWPVKLIKFTLDNPVDAHYRLLSKYTDDDIHNLMAYLQTLR